MITEKESIETCVNAFYKNAAEHICIALKSINQFDIAPIILGIGSDLVIGDALGPLVGTILIKKKINAYVYGTLNYPITAKEINCVKTQLKEMHKSNVKIAIDSGVGKDEDVGLIKIFNKPLKPGLGVKKALPQIGDISIVGIVAAKSEKNYTLFNLTRLNLIYKMAEVISDGISLYINDLIKSKTIA